MTEKDFFEKTGLEVTEGNPEVGETYPLYGMITEIIDNSNETLTVVINFSIKLKINNLEKEKKDIVVERAFEPGIFVTEIIKKEEDFDIDNGIYPYEGVCKTVVFGKKKELNEV